MAGLSRLTGLGLEHKAALADNAEQPASGAVKSIFDGEGMLGGAPGGLGERLLVAGLRRRPGGDARQRLVDDAGTRERRARGMVNGLGGRFHRRAEARQQRALPKRSGGDPVERRPLV